MTQEELALKCDITLRMMLNRQDYQIHHRRQRILRI
jgi:hypothetical protein